MKEYRRQIIAAVILFAAALFFRFALVGYSFLAYILMGAAAVVLVYMALRILSHRRDGAAKLLRRLVTAGLALLILAFAVTECFIVAEVIGAGAPKGANWAIVLGAGVNGKTPSLSLRVRLDAALDFAGENPDSRLVLSGGMGEGEDITEAQCMYDWLVARGVEPERLIMEPKAVSTEENLDFSRELIAGVDPDFDSVTIVTAGYHILRAKLMAEDAGFENVTAVPAVTARPVLELNYYLREAVAIWYYLIF